MNKNNLLETENYVRVLLLGAGGMGNLPLDELVKGYCD